VALLVPADERRTVQSLAAVLAGDAIFDSVAKQWVHDDLERLRVPQGAVRVIVAAKSAAAAGLVVGLRRRPLGVLTSACLVVYFVLAVGAHARARDAWWHWVLAVLMLGWCARVFRLFRHGDLAPQP
jgi:hypothetical protein